MLINRNRYVKSIQCCRYRRLPIDADTNAKKLDSESSRFFRAAEVDDQPFPNVMFHATFMLFNTIYLIILQEIKSVVLDEHLNSGGDDEMELSDEDEVVKKKPPRFDDRIHAIRVRLMIVVPQNV